MKRFLVLIGLIAVLSLNAFTQDGSEPKKAIPDKPASVVGAVTPLDLAMATLAGHGGDKLKKMRSLVMKGSADLTFQGQAVLGAFSTAISGDKYYFEIVTAIQQLKQTFDGRETYSSITGFSLPPVTSLGFPLLPRVGDAGYAVSALAGAKKGKKGFRITSPEGFYTDFYVNEKTGQIKGYDSSFESAGRVVTTSVEIDGYQTVEGIVVPTKYSQRFDLGPITAYANFRTKEVLINSTIEDSAFSIPK